MANTSDGNNLRPFITLFAESRRGANPLPGKYDDELQVTVLNESGKKTPIIKAYRAREIYTKTEADRESDEDSTVLLETETKTMAWPRESDDINVNLPELATKTDVKRESDDDHLFSLELQTKTRMEREGDDNHFGF
jgi:hypothetical protein